MNEQVQESLHAPLADRPDTNVARIFNSYVASAAVAAAWEVDALDELNKNRQLNIATFADAHRLNLDATRAMFTALAAVEIVDVRGEHVACSTNFDETYRAKSFFHWLVRGSSDLFTRMSDLMSSAERGDSHYQRDAAAISVACRDINATYFDPVFWTAMEGAAFTKSADLGCGSGERLLQILRRYPGTNGIGIDIANGALAVAAEAANNAGMSGRVDFVKADARHLVDRPEYADVDLLTCFLMGHDFWPMDDCVDSLRRIRDAFPNVRKFLLGDTARTAASDNADFQIFTLGFEVGHALMGAYLPTLEEWDLAIQQSGWICVKQHHIVTPAATVIFELEPR